MGISSALQWWEEWQLRVLVLATLFVYCILDASFMVRWTPSLRRLRVVIWMAYIGTDALAIYALASLFNRHKQTTTRGGDAVTATALEVVWAPVLLIYLGGHPTMSAYSLEDNELWTRHAITFVSQVTVALYVFCKWWSGEKRLLQAAVLLFIVGIIKSAQKPWALKAASFNSMLDSIPMSMKEGRGYEERDLTIEEYVERVKECVRQRTEETEGQEVTSCADIDIDEYTNRLFVDMSAPYYKRYHEVDDFMKLNNKHAYDMLQQYLAHTFEVLYSRLRSGKTSLGICLRILLPCMCIAPVVLLAMSNMDGYDNKDVRVTYSLYCGNLIIEFFPILTLCLFLPYKPFRKFISTPRRWHKMVSQSSLMSFCARKRKPTTLMKLATFCCLKDYINMNWYIQQVPVAPDITGLVREHLTHGWKELIQDAVGYRRFNNQLSQSARNSFNVPFDRTVLVWHIATELCFYGASGKDTQLSRRSLEISNYMIYLLSIRPEMLMPGTRPYLFIAASKQIELILNDSIRTRRQALPDKEESIARVILSTTVLASIRINLIDGDGDGDPTTLITDARSVARTLLNLGVVQRWTLIQRTWVEMLCYSAARCRGYLHAQSLGDGGECLTSVWLLSSLMGMETLADKLQRPEPSLGNANAGTPSTSPSQGAESQSPEEVTSPSQGAEIQSPEEVTSPV